MRTSTKQQPKQNRYYSHQVISNPSIFNSFVVGFPSGILGNESRKRFELLHSSVRFTPITQGATVGMGSSVGHRIVDGVFKENPTINEQQNAPTKLNQPTITFDDPYLCNKKMEQYVKCTHEQSNHSICDKLYDNYLLCVSSFLDREQS